MTTPDLQRVKEFWESHPLFSGESQYLTGSREFFEQHRYVCINDCFAGQIDSRIFPNPLTENLRVLDAGCGIGMWTLEFLTRGVKDVVAIDLTRTALNLTRTRRQMFAQDSSDLLSQGSVDSLPFRTASFDHVNCQGVLHHIPDPSAGVKEFFRVLRPGGTLLISVYYKGVTLRSWGVVGSLVQRLRMIRKLGLAGRGRNDLLKETDMGELVRKYDGDQNPIGVAFDRKGVWSLVQPFEVDYSFLHYFPTRMLSRSLPTVIKKLLDRHFGLLIFVLLRKPVERIN